MVSGRPGDHRRCGLESEFGPARMEGMDANKLFEMALGMGNGWRVVKSEMDVAGRQLQLWLDFAPVNRKGSMLTISVSPDGRAARPKQTDRAPR